MVKKWTTHSSFGIPHQIKYFIKDGKKSMEIYSKQKAKTQSSCEKQDDIY
tara:strand:- start:296 stop:445 length:150 start_codon:yes stop_codon:yes gene_type:complete